MSRRMGSCCPLQYGDPVQILMPAQESGKVAEPQQASPSLLGAVGCQKQCLIVVCQAGDTSTGNGLLDQLRPNLSGPQREYHAVSRELPVQINDEIALSASKCVLAKVT